MYHIIGDTHFHHSILVNEGFRPENYEQKLYRSMNRLGVGDILIHLGDVTMGWDEAMHGKYILPLTCTTILVKGNHDNKSNTWYLNHGWDFVCDTFTDRIFGLNVLFSHAPRKYDGWYDVNLHAHLHNTGHRDGEYLLVKNDKQLLYAAEDFDYQVMPLKYLLDRFI